MALFILQVSYSEEATAEAAPAVAEAAELTSEASDAGVAE